MSHESNHLRCSLVWERTLLEERSFAPGSRITAGESSYATFTLPSAYLGKRHLLFRHGRSRTVLSLLPGMLGRVQLGGRTCEVEDLVDDRLGQADRVGDELRYELGPGDGGVLVFDRTGLVFQFDSGPGALPPAKIGQVLGVDKHVSRLFTGGVALVAFLILVSRLFAASGPRLSVEQLPDRFVSFVVEDPDKALDFQKEMEKLRKKQIEEQKRREERAKRTPKRVQPDPKTRPESPADRPADDAETQRIREKVKKQGVVGELAKARKRSGALREVLADGGLGMKLDRAMRALDRGQASARLLTAKGAGGIPLPSLHSRRGTEEALGEGIVESGPRTGRRAGRMSRTSRLTEQGEVRVSLPSSDATVSGGSLGKGEIASVIQRNKGAIKYCYESQLMRYPTLRGKVVVDFIIEMDGSVRTVKIPTNTLNKRTAKGNVASCLMRFIRRWRFPKPQGGKVRVIYPFTFGRSR
ncbi:MAG: AgmX/PglI C-terminal domain-containing protein [Deltaproteobacteria bacterium]|nr:AgmX/PglI C-terminal domain-containing protein [Deltaproteobacteria bacterium]